MNDYMKEAKRLAQAYADAVLLGEGNDEALAALLAHIQRGAVPDGLQVVPKVASDAMLRPFYECPPEELQLAWQAAMLIAKTQAKREAALQNIVSESERLGLYDASAAPAPDHFRDAAEMVAEPADDRIASAIHYPECWDTAAYPTVESALSEVFAHYRCTEHDAPAEPERRIGPASDADMAVYQSIADGYARDTAPAPAEVPMPEQDGWFCWAGSERGHSPFFSGYEPLAHSERERAFTQTKMRTYGAACRAAGEAAGYARGLKEADKLLQALRDIADPIAAYERDLPPGYTLDGAACVRMADNPETYRRMAREAIADLREEVKP